MYKGVTFESVRRALYALYFYQDGDTTEDMLESFKYIIPMQHNFFIPIEKETEDTYILYFIDRDTILNQDSILYDRNLSTKRAEVSVRFVGINAESWAKALHHLTKRNDTYKIFLDVCNAERLEQVDDIVPVNVDYFGNNTSIAFDARLFLTYTEELDLDWEALKKVTLAGGTFK